MSTQANKHDELADRIQAAVLSRGENADHGQHFIRPWRLDASQDVRHGTGLTECGCGISQEDPPLR
jgi:hypothetical protein